MGRFYNVYNRLGELDKKPTLHGKFKKYAMIVRATKGFGRLGSKSCARKDDILKRYKDDLIDFCKLKALYKVETVDNASVAAFQVYIHKAVSSKQKHIQFSSRLIVQYLR